MRRKLFSLVVCALCVGALWLLPASASSARSELMGKGGDYARDCTSLPFLDGKRPHLVRYVVWCGVQAGKVRFSLHRDGGIPIAAYPHRISPAGEGAGQSFRCRRVIEAIKCLGRIHGPVTIRGWISVREGKRCIPVAVHNAGDGRAGITPRGCPGTKLPRPPHDGWSMRSFRRQSGLDRDLEGDKEAIRRRMVSLIRAWKRGSPVERATEAEWFVPLSARDQRELEYQDEYIKRDGEAIERWAASHASTTFAGWTVDGEAGGIVYIGFVGDQEARIAEFEKQVRVLAPERIKPFPVPPRFSERELTALEEEVAEFAFGAKHYAFVNSISVNVLGNAVEIGTEHVMKVRELMAKRFGSGAPIHVTFQHPAVLLDGFQRLKR